MAYKTKQREYILAFLQNSAGRHITVAELVRHLQDNETPVGTATVYRTLEQLVEEGIVRKYVLDGKSSACYQFLSGEPHACTEHFHLKCTQCGQLFHVSCDYLNQLGEHLLEHHGFVIDHTKTVLYGLCAACSRKNRDVRVQCEAAPLALELSQRCGRLVGVIGAFIDADRGIVKSDIVPFFL